VITFSSPLAANTNILLLIRDVLLPASGDSVNNIPVLVTTENSVTKAILESRLLFDYISPIAKTSATVGAATLSVSSTTLGSTSTYSFSGINLPNGLDTAPSGKVIIVFPKHFNFLTLDNI
jgi:hypothetical protein